MKTFLIVLSIILSNILYGQKLSLEDLITLRNTQSAIDITEYLAMKKWVFVRESKTSEGTLLQFAHGFSNIGLKEAASLWFSKNNSTGVVDYYFTEQDDFIKFQVLLKPFRIDTKSSFGENTYSSEYLYKGHKIIIEANDINFKYLVIIL